MSVRAAGIPKPAPIPSSPYVPELISLSEALPMMGIAFWCVWVASAAEPPEVSVVSVCESSSCPVMAMKAANESLSCPVLSCPVTAMKAVCESLPCPGYGGRLRILVLSCHGYGGRP